MGNNELAQTERAPAMTRGDLDFIPNSTTLTIGEHITLAKVYAKSGLFLNAGKAEEAVIKMQVGQTFGLNPVASMLNIDVLKTGSGDYAQVSFGLRYTLILAMISQHEHYDYRVKEKTAERAVIDFYEDGELIGTETFTIDEAIQQHGAEKVNKTTGNWFKIRSTMLFARCASRGARTYCPAVFMGHAIYAREELEDIGTSRGSLKETQHMNLGDAIAAKLDPRVEPEPVTEAEFTDEGVPDNTGPELTRLKEMGLSDQEILDFAQVCDSAGKSAADVLAAFDAENGKTIAQLFDIAGRTGML